jgi:hypothetical protein
MRTLIRLFIVCSGLITVLAVSEGCYNDNSALPTPAICDTTKVKYAAFVAPLMKAQCATSGCHSAIKRAADIDLSSYTTTTDYIRQDTVDYDFLGVILHSRGFVEMPKGGNKLSDCEIHKLEAWIDAGLPNN